jgi:hypothetical protein
MRHLPQERHLRKCTAQNAQPAVRGKQRTEAGVPERTGEAKLA